MKTIAVLLAACAASASDQRFGGLSSLASFAADSAQKFIPGNVGDIFKPPGQSNNPSPTTCICPTLYDPVCGSDGRRYGNSCQAKCAKTTVACKGSCPCNEGIVCRCPGWYKPICGTDGKTHRNECVGTCGKDVRVACEGPCPCNGDGDGFDVCLCCNTKFGKVDPRCYTILPNCASCQ